MNNNTLYNEKTISRLTSNLIIKEKQRKSASRWINLLKEGKLEKERNVYIEFANTILKDLLNYDVGIESLKHEKANMEFPFTKPDGKYAVYFEAKGAKVKNLFAKQYRTQIGYYTPVSQTWTKMSEFPIPYGVCTNYRDFILLDYSKGNRRYHIFNFLDIENNDDKLKEFIAIFSKESIIDSNFLETLYSESTDEESKFSSDFYNIFHETRLMLIKEFNECGINNLDAIKYSQLFLNRILFIFFAESTGKMPRKIFQTNILNILKLTMIFKGATHFIYDVIIQIFETLNKGSEVPIKIFGFNGELFKENIPTHVFFKDYRSKEFFKVIGSNSNMGKRLEFDSNVSKILELHKNNLNLIVKNIFILGSFDFNTEVNVNILGHIFEQSISDIEELKGLKEISKRKQEGIYYTPEFITDYICLSTITSYLSKKDSNSIEALIEEYSDNIVEMENKINKIKILDLACGSGAFLLKAIEVLIDIKKDIIEYKSLKGLFKTEIPRAKSRKGEYSKAPIFESLDKFNEIAEIRNIIQKNIYGVDVNEESVEITKLSIFFKICERNEKLLDLTEIIKCGNSLISDSAIVGNKAFDWKNEFKNIMDDGGFDIIIGNPPYINAITMRNHFPKQRNYLKNNYSHLIERWDIYIAFIERALELLKPSGYFSYILPDAFLTEKYSMKIREYIKRNLRVVKVDYFPNINIFKGVGVKNIILSIQNEPPRLPVEKNCFNELEQKPLTKKVKDFEEIFTSYESEKIELNEEVITYLADICYISKGMVLNSKEPQYKGLFKKADVISDVKTEACTHKIIFGENIFPYNIKGFNYVEWGTDRVPTKVSRPTFSKLHQKNKLVSNKIGKLKIALDNYGYKCDQTVRILIKWDQIKGIENKSIKGSIKKFANFPREKLEEISKSYDYYFLLGLLNSKFVQFYFNKLRGQSSFDINPLVLRRIPIPLIENLDKQKEVIDATKRILINIEKKNLIRSNFIKLIKTEFKIDISNKLESWYVLNFENFLQELERVIRKLGKKEGKKFRNLSLSQKSEWMNFFDVKKKEIIDVEENIKKAEDELNLKVFRLYNLSNEDIKKII